MTRRLLLLFGFLALFVAPVFAATYIGNEETATVSDDEQEITFTNNQSGEWIHYQQTGTQLVITHSDGYEPVYPNWWCATCPGCTVDYGPERDCTECSSSMRQCYDCVIERFKKGKYGSIASANASMSRCAAYFKWQPW